MNARDALGSIVVVCALALTPLCNGAEVDRSADPTAERSPNTPDASHARERIEWLRAEIARNDELYFKKAAPEITDAAYDALKRELAALERAYPGFAQASSFGDDRSGRFPAYRHRVRMLGLDKSYTEEELRAFVGRVAKQLGRGDLKYVVEPKYDGLAISVTYQKGRFVRAVTRGNGTEGDDVTENARTIRGLPIELNASAPDGSTNPTPEIVELRGEVYVGFAEFARINREQEESDEEPFANPRNLAAGSLKLADPAAVAERKLEIVFYGWGAWEPASSQPASQQALHAMIRAWGLPGVKQVRLAADAGDVWEAVQAFGRERGRFGFPTDGAVVKVDDASLWPELGATEESPRWAMAFKFPAERVRTRVRAITLQVGRSGVLTPVAELETVAIGGSKVSRASLHNRDWIAEHDIRIGDFVFIEKAGEIIPQIAGVDLSARPAASEPYAFPSECPECHATLESSPTDAFVRCTNDSCPPQIRRRIEHFASSSCVDIRGLGPAVIRKLVEKGWVDDVSDLYRLRREDLLTLGSNVEASTDQLLAAIERSKRTELWRVINGLGIPGVGAVCARKLAAKYGSLEAFAKACDSRVDEAVAQFLADERNRSLVQDLITFGVGSGAAATATPAG